MKKKLHTVILLLSLSFTLSSFNHPIKLTSSEIKYDSKTNSLGMESKVFIDDFAQAFFNKSFLARMSTSNLSEIDKKQIENYFMLKFEISINGNKIPLKFEKYAVKDNVMTISFAKKNISLKKGDKIYIENELLFEEFEDLQSNWITLRIPPFIPNYNFACDIENYSYSRTF